MTHREGQLGMNALVDIETASRYARTIEDNEARRLGARVSAVRASIARRIGVAPATLANLRKLRTKAVPNWLMARIRAEFVAVLENEVARLEHEIQIARQVGTHHSDDVLAAAEAQVVTAKKLLTGD